MAVRLPALRVDHVSIAVREIAPALARLRRILPLRMRVEPRGGYDEQFRWADFFLGTFKLELIESARPGSFVERFIERYGQGFHHLSIDVEEGALAAYTAALESEGLRIVDRGDYGDGDETAFISPRTSPGILVQFWQVTGFHGEWPDDYPTEPVAERDGVRFRIAHLGLAVRSADETLDWFRRFFPVELDGARTTTDGLRFRLADYPIALVAPHDPSAGDAREGFHHLAIDVHPLDRLLERLAADGLRIVERTAVDGRAAASLHRDDVHGVLLRFRESPDLAPLARR